MARLDDNTLFAHRPSSFDPGIGMTPGGWRLMVAYDTRAGKRVSTKVPLILFCTLAIEYDIIDYRPLARGRTGRLNLNRFFSIASLSTSFFLVLHSFPPHTR
ncbi:hypothetical protein P168DRAFT_181861 [Aspergillus campestris IBT 28561]|uniref:Uncharacterized protein n=1 Tax=Aspergillus campestris (strain IBT 28561) TaxID=1392248 RepID=A0A2I1D0E2_ASPC2|nr:uncharacterized protein P168DRAFT_181861 [Aspergillus campestris IBT 28561]PKY03344.1 hypothetical protein P168DRAFT_181861 [Aspergillus campestris IBT 28561]